MLLAVLVAYSVVRCMELCCVVFKRVNCCIPPPSVLASIYPQFDSSINLQSGCILFLLYQYILASATQCSSNSLPIFTYHFKAQKEGFLRAISFIAFIDSVRAQYPVIRSPTENYSPVRNVTKTCRSNQQQKNYLVKKKTIRIKKGMVYQSILWHLHSFITILIQN